MTPLQPLGSPGTETLLIVENEAAIRTLLQMGLRRNGYTVLAAASGGEALNLVRAHDGPIDLVITDIIMPNMSGPELIRELSIVRPGMRALFMSGYRGDTSGKDSVLPTDHFIQKPFSPRVLADRVRDILDRGQRES